MSGIALDPATGDILITANKATLTTGVEATRQRLTSKLRFLLGEWFLDKTKGIPYREQILVKNPNPTVVDAVLKREIINDPAVLKLTKFETNINSVTRQLNVDFAVITDDGPIDFSLSVPS